ncbi:hypothetical protein [Clostridium fungisolvens]|uniref:Uncharacterized protein n=1 Tax=Clostridium fungisolvens TaxID=1604897 RepID=A0A6V8SI34_9CLOT|nr:hypothetical protein [Clostridium fungisolvens]GFP76889.1 hypothetical protein bsdtw1_02999 [Clostridium fungisolvens]
MGDLTVNDIIADRPCGSITPLVVGLEDALYPIIIIKEMKEDLLSIGVDTPMGVKSTSIGDKKANVYAIILKFGEDFENIYDIWFNYGDENHQDFLKLLRDQHRIVIDFRDENNERYLTLEFENTVREHIDDYIEKCSEKMLVRSEKDNNVIKLNSLEKYNIWNDDDIENLMDKIFTDYPSIEELWEDL